MIQVNDTYHHTFSYSQQQVEEFARVTGDNNPVHTDAAYAANTMFKVPIMHGMLGAALFSKIFGTLFPGEGTIYLGQTLNFLRPMYAGKEYEAVFTVKEVMIDKNRAVVETKIIDPETQKTVTVGEATVMNVDKIK
jgi:acyl dehydratase